MKKFIIFLLVPFLCFSQVNLDTTFSDDGKVIFDNCPYGVTNDLSLDNTSDNKIILGYRGAANLYGFFFKFNADGNLDTSFGTNGYFELSSNTTTVLQPESNYSMVELEVQNDNKIVSSGRRESIAASTFCISRMNPNGGLDTTFNGTGFLEVSFDNSVSRGNCMKLQSDGKILVGGYSGNSSEFFSILRLNSNGTLDNSFGTLGKVQTLMMGQSLPYSIALQSDGKILMGGYVLNNPYGYDFALVRYLSNGTLDTSFGTNGIVVTTISAIFSDSIRKVLVQNDGRIIVVGNYADSSGESRVAMVRYLNNGAIDTSFAANGIYIADFYSATYDAALQIDNKIVLSSSTYDYDLNFFRFNIIRFNPDSVVMDNNFISSNSAFPFSLLESRGSSIKILPDNKIIACGSSFLTTNPCGDLSGLLVRINPGPLLSNNEFEENQLVFYPNPTENVVSFDNSISQYQKAAIFNILGQEVGTITLKSLMNESIDLKGFSNGAYLIKLSNQNSLKTIKIIKK
jgi:uncharacterized delta-60 repeat protein